ncbi:recombinase family protein [Tissierella praeacuta]|uniref:recombinase family protein n=1 Tax=Tissierella praeacuta TaxID=43131 RepID=UPI001C110395|nr:recombinase family protein [Tissierella praeacuta]MBU5257228.1 recombinase family protein [Tissierella praeacuta]
MEKTIAYMYLRLSRDDGDEGESNSIGNQRELIKSYADKAGFQIIKEYIDDGFTGSNFDRPDFKRMISDLEKKNCKTIIVKDLSRFGRDYIESGKFLQKIFPQMGVRFISVNDNYDSENADVSDTHLILPIKNFINDSYCRDISMKVKSSQKTKRQRGEFIGAFAPYGYKKNSKKKNHLVVDRKISHIVRKIFEMKVEGYSSKAIADELNRLGIQTPQAYKESNGSNFSTGFANNKSKWQAKMINRIIENRVYLGDLEQGKRTRLNYKSNKEIKVTQDDWIKVEGTHEAIVTETMFNVANKMMGRDILNRKSKPDFLTGLLYCADCGNQLVRRNLKTKNGQTIYYICSLYNRGKGCSRHSIKEEDILSSLNYILKQHIKYQEDLFLRIRQADLSKSEYDLDLDDLLAEKKKYETLRRSLYMDLEDELIDEEEFQSFRKSYQLKIKEVEQQITNRKKAYNDLEEILNSKENWLTGLEKYKNIESIDRQTLAFFVDRILVGEKDEDGRPRIAVFFNDMEKLDILKRITEGVKKNKASNLVSFNNMVIKGLSTEREGVALYG